MKRRLVLVSLITVVGLGLFFVSCKKNINGCKCVESIANHTTNYTFEQVQDTGADDCDEFESKMNANMSNPYVNVTVSCTEY